MSAPVPSRGLTTALRMVAVAELPPAHDESWRELLPPDELGYCAGLARAGEHLAAAVAGRAAVLAVLGRPGAEAEWRDVRLVRAHGCLPQVVLHGPVERWRHDRSLPVPGVSLSHAAGHAAALAWLPAPGTA